MGTWLEFHAIHFEASTPPHSYCSLITSVALMPGVEASRGVMSIMHECQGLV